MDQQLFLHTDKNHSILLLETNKLQFDLYLFMFALNLLHDLGMNLLALKQMETIHTDPPYQSVS